MEQVQKIRHHDLDWLRVIAIMILLFYHVGMIFVSWGWHIKNQQSSKAFEYVMAWLHLWRMPLLLFISGAGTFFALGFRDSKTYIKERHKRLLIPLIIGMFIIVPPQIYYEFIPRFQSYLDFYPTVFDFVPYPAGGSFSWHHLWFIAYLLLYSLIGLPLFLYLRKPESKGFRDRMASLLTKKAGFAFFLLPIFITQLILRPFFPQPTHALINDWAYFIYYFLFFIFGYMIYCDKRIWESIKNQRGIHVIISLISLILFYLAHYYSIKINFLAQFGFLETIISWFWVLTIIGYGQVYLRKGSTILKYANEGIYPFYILHQTAIVMIGYYIIKWRLDIASKFIIISLLAIISCLAVYVLFIRPFNSMRILFGMKPINKKSVFVGNLLSNNQYVSKLR